MRFGSTIFCALLLTAAARAGVVWSVADRLEGKVVVQTDGVAVDGKKVAWADVLYLQLDSPPPSRAKRERVCLTNGECLAAAIVEVANKQLVANSERFGELKFPIAKLAAIDFGRLGRDQKADTLFRTRSESVTGKLLVVTKDKVFIDSVVGEIELPRNTIAAYRFAADQPRRGRNEDWVYLTDGSILRGQAVPQADGFRVDRSGNAALTVPTNHVAAIVRHPARMLDLAETTPKSTKSASLLMAGERTPATGADRRFVKKLELEPRSAMTFKIVADKAGNGTLRTALAAKLDAVGDCKLTIKVGDKVVFEREVAPGARPEPIAVPVKSGDEIELSVDFGGRLRFPCGVVLGDPHVIWQ